MCDRLEDFTKEELISLIHGLEDCIAGRVLTTEELNKRLNLE